jgi:hypothetical protein
MSRNGSGTYNLPSGNPVVTGTTITSAWANTTLNDIASALTGSVAADGQTPVTGDINMGSNKISNLAVPTSSTDAATKNYVDTAVTTATGGLGTMSTQNKTAVDITGGTIAGTTISNSVSVGDTIGNVRNLPILSKTASYTLLATDNGQVVSITTGGVIVPASVFSAGQSVSIYNNSGSSQTITTTGVTVTQAGTGLTGNRTLGAYGLCTILCIASNTFVITGAGVA